LGEDGRLNDDEHNACLVVIHAADFRDWHKSALSGRAGGACLLCPGISDINLFRYCKGIIHFDAEISDRCACRKSNSHIQVMKSAKKWRRQNAPNGMYCSRRRCVLVD
jgi:hypothetical protein